MIPEDLVRQKPARIIRDCLWMGIKAWTQRQHSITFEEAARRLMEIKAGRSARTQQDIRQCLRRLGEGSMGWNKRLLSSITLTDCAKRLEQAFPQPTRRVKARSVLCSLFNEGMRRDWCRENPAKGVELPFVREREIRALKPEEIERLLQTASAYQDGACLPAVGLMLYAGIRPWETSRLHWCDVDWDEGEVIVPAKHSKTGGGRHVPMCPALRVILNQGQSMNPQSRICPANWINKWRELRRLAGFEHWQQDALRHTFASYFVKCYRDLNALQLFMGHSSLNLLRTRYVNLRGLRLEDAHKFWYRNAPVESTPGDWYCKPQTPQSS